MPLASLKVLVGRRTGHLLCVNKPALIPLMLAPSRLTAARKALGGHTTALQQHYRGSAKLTACAPDMDGAKRRPGPHCTYCMPHSRNSLQGDGGPARSLV